MSELIPLSELDNRLPADADYAVFGGTFDPFHAGHASVVKALMPYFASIIIAPASANPWKPLPPTGVELRKEMIRLVLQAEKIELQSAGRTAGVAIDDFDYCYVEDYVRAAASRRAGRLYWAVGADEAEEAQKWRNFALLNLTVIVAPIVIETHARFARENVAELHPAIRTFAQQHGLYRRGG